MKILVLQHADCEHPGFFRQLLEEDDHQWVPVELDQGETAPPLDGFDALWVMGGPMDTWQEDAHPCIAIWPSPAARPMTCRPAAAAPARRVL